VVYKYYPADREMFFADPYISFSPPSILNDPLECKPTITLKDIDRHIDNLVQRNFLRVVLRYGNTLEAHDRLSWAADRLRETYRKNPEVLIGRVLDAYLRDINADIGILSLSKIRDNELMWAHYCSGHEGFVVGFDEENEFFKRSQEDPLDCGVLREVTYTDERISVDVDNIVVSQELIFTKKAKWSYEQEVRMMRALATADKIIDKGNFKLFLFKVPKSAIKEVVFGIKCAPKTVELIRRTITADKEYRDVKLYRAEYNNDANFCVVTAS
jgi:hypothetical protein